MRFLSELGVIGPRRPSQESAATFALPARRRKRRGRLRRVLAGARPTAKYPRLPSYVPRYREQKVCSYCKHPIDEDPYFEKQGLWVRYFQNRGYWLRYIMLEIVTALALVLGHISDVFYELLMKFKTHFTLPGWVRCANPQCGQLYHANCWYELKKQRGCFRCQSRHARRVLIYG
jgi:hypothetical protein